MLRLADLEVGAAEVALRTERLRLQSAEAEVDAATVRVQLAELDMEQALRRREAVRRQEDAVSSGASSPPSSPPAKRTKTTDDSEKAKELLGSLRVQEVSAAQDVMAARGRLLDLKQRLRQRQEGLLDSAPPTVDLQGTGEHHTEMTLATLPEDELLRVLRCLETRQLLLCRGVCRRLRDLALHPSLWRSRSLDLGITASVELVAATLRLAPCLRTLSLDMGSQDLYVRLGTLLVSTNCAIGRLKLELAARGGLFAAMILVRQAALGRLNAVSVTLRPTEHVDSSVELRLLLDQLLHTPGLTSVQVKYLFDSFHFEKFPDQPCLPKAAKCDVPVPASLRRLVYDPAFKDGNMTFYLRWHADTLQVVHLGAVHPHAGVTPLLCSLPHLRDLQCALLENMPALLQCPKLKSLNLVLNVDKSTRPLLPGVQQFIRMAVTRLETLTLKYPSGDVCADAVNLVLSIAGPSQGAQPALRKFSLDYEDGLAWVPQPQLPPLAAVLHRLRNLVTLDLCGPHTPSFLDAMDGKVLPSLQRLCVYLVEDDWGGGCPHEWAHAEEARALLRRYPRLHLQLDTNHPSAADDDEPCTFCSENNCHDFDNSTHTLFSHPVGEHCSQDHGEVDIHIVV